MASYTATQAFIPLRVVTWRISNTPTKQLPHVAPILAASIAECKKAFHTPQNENQSRSGSESAILLHKLKTQLSALLQDKQPQARYAAVVFIKAAVQVGGSNVLQGAAPWVRNLIGIMRVSDSSAGQACQTSSISVLSDRVKLSNLPIYCLCIPLLTYECRDRIL